MEREGKARGIHLVAICNLTTVHATKSYTLELQRQRTGQIYRMTQKKARARSAPTKHRKRLTWKWWWDEHHVQAHCIFNAVEFIHTVANWVTPLTHPPKERKPTSKPIAHRITQFQENMLFSLEIVAKWCIPFSD